MTGKKHLMYLILFLVVTSIVSNIVYSQNQLPMFEDFHIAVVPNFIEASRGQNVSARVYVEILGSLTINIWISECPKQFTCTLDRNIFTSFGYANLNIKIPENVSLGEYKVVVTGDGGLFGPKNATLIIKITDKSGQITETPYFDIKVYPKYVELYRGQSTTITINVTIVGPLSVYVIHSGCPFCTKCRISRTTFTESGIAILNITTSDISATGIFNITIRATDNRSVTKTEIVTIRILEEVVRPEPIPLPPIADFNISVSPVETRIYQGQETLARVNITIVGPLRVNLSLQGCPANSICILNQTTFTQSGEALLRIFTTNNTPPGTYTITIRAIDNRSVTKTATFTLYVIKIPEPIIPPPPTPPHEPIPLPPIADFNISVSRTYLKVLKGNEITTLVNVTIVGNITVELLLQGCPEKSICTLNQTIFTKSGIALLKIYTNSTPNVYTIKLIGRSGNIEKTINLILDVIDYEIFVPEMINITAGETRDFLIAIKRYGMFYTNISLTCPLGITCRIIDSGKGDEIEFYNISVQVSKDIQPGIHTIIVRVAVDGYERQHQIKLNVSRPVTIITPEPPKVTEPREVRKISLIAGAIGAQLPKEKDITEVISIPEKQVFEEYKIEKEEIKIKPEAPTTIELEKGYVVYETEEIVFNKALDIIILIAIAIVLIEILLIIILKRKKF